MKNFILLLFVILFTNNTMEETKASYQTKDEKNSLLALVDPNLKGLSNDEFVIILPGIKSIRMTNFHATTLDVIKQHIYTYLAPLPPEEQAFYPFIYSNHFDTIMSYPLKDWDDKKKMFDVMEEQKTNTFMVFGKLCPLSMDLNKKIAALIVKNQAIQKN